MTAPDPTVPRPLPRVSRALLRDLTDACRGVVDDAVLDAIDTEADGYFRALTDAARGSNVLTMAALPLPPDAVELGRALWPVADLVRLAHVDGKAGATLELADRVLDVLVRVALLQEARSTSTSGVVGLLERSGDVVVALTRIDPFAISDENPIWRVDR
ncbi:MAG: hypothetical protein H6733_08430 [Alphaproteobacteria bacterium]|nr:hypothetical protein [Alphaproteobacteria bacterium]